MRWTEKKDKELKKLVEGGMRYPDIANNICVTYK
jgi:hypothetical protein